MTTAAAPVITSRQRRPRQPRHPAQITNDRLEGHYERWFARLSERERRAFDEVQDALLRIADEDEAR